MPTARIPELASKIGVAELRMVRLERRLFSGLSSDMATLPMAESEMAHPYG
ncbi:MAG: hypothetical protein P8Y58_01715 [Novosphingobium sp.]